MRMAILAGNNPYVPRELQGQLPAPEQIERLLDGV